MIFPRMRKEYSGEQGRRIRTNVPPAVETLEGRTLLSNTNVAALAGLPLAVQRYHPGPIRDVVGNGYAVKDPRFYLYYLGQGPARAEINGASSSALFVNGGSLLELNGEVAGPLVKNPTSPAQDSYYVFGINRGGAVTPGPFPGKPNITFDAVVTVSITQAGWSAQVQDLTGPNTAPVNLPLSDLFLKVDTIKVFVPSSLLPPTGPNGLKGYSVNFWAQNQAAPANYTQIASFTPEGRDYPIRDSSQTVAIVNSPEPQ